MFRYGIGAALLAVCFGAGTVQAQTNRQPWQGMFNKTSHSGGTPRLVLDLPLPATGKLLTIERISISLGPTASIYGKLLSCEIETSHPRLLKSEYVADRTRYPLSQPVFLGQPTRSWGITNEAVLVYADSNAEGVLRVVCDSEYLSGSDRFTVTASGYTSDK